MPPSCACTSEMKSNKRKVREIMMKKEEGKGKERKRVVMK